MGKIPVVAERVDGERLRELRLSRLLTQRDLARRAGVSSETINRIENAETPRSATSITIYKIAAALEVSPSELIVED